ncbi:hypothetical protein BDZ97DRAFT_1928086 [Flammula alnicola]|nr:hypothetical protein BDZ97DRAFT_1928086 [Flammula alnicola]
MQLNIPNTSSAQPANQPPSAVPMAVDGAPTLARPAIAPCKDPQTDALKIVVSDAMDLVNHPGDPNVSATSIPHPADLVEPPARANPTFFVVTVGEVVGIFDNVDAIGYKLGAQPEFNICQFSNWHQAFGFYLAHHNNKMIRIVPPMPPASPGTSGNPVYVASNAPTPAKVPAGAFGNPIFILSSATTPASKAASHNAAAPGAAAPIPFLLPPPPKPIKSPAPSAATPTPAPRMAEAPSLANPKSSTSAARSPRILAPDLETEDPPQRRVRQDVVVISDSDSDDLPQPPYPSSTPVGSAKAANTFPATPFPPRPTLRPFPAPSPISGSSPLPSSSFFSTPAATFGPPSNTKKRFIPLFEDDPPAVGSNDDPLNSPDGGSLSKKKKKEAPAAPSESSMRRFEAIQACFSAPSARHASNSVDAAPSSLSSTRAQATSSAATLSSPFATTTVKMLSVGCV